MLQMMTLLVPIGIVLILAIPNFRRRHAIRFAVAGMATLIVLKVIR